MRVAILIVMAVVFLGTVCRAETLDEEHYNKGVAYAVEGKFLEAKEEFLAGLTSDHPFVSPLQTSLAIINDALGNKINREAALHIFKAADLGNKESFDKAIKELDIALTIEPDYFLIFNARGSLYGLKGEQDKALRDFKEVIRKKPDFAKAYLNCGVIYASRGEYEEAINEFSRALEFDPRYAQAYCDRGMIYAGQELFEKAISDFSKAITLYAKYETAYFNRGMAYLESELNSEAAADFSQVLNLNPKNTAAYFYYASACERIGRLKDALDAYAFFVRSAPQQEEYQSYLSLIEKAKARIAILSRLDKRNSS